MKNKDEYLLKMQMLSDIKSGGAWFTTRQDNYLKIGYIRTDDCLCARECILRNGSLEGGAYTFGLDWFDIYFHGRYIDIYADPETFRRWDIVYDPVRGTCCNAPEDSAKAKRITEFCGQADQEALAGIGHAYHISKAAFADMIALSEEG